MRINKHDINGTKPLLGKGELGYDDYTAGGDTGRVYVGTGADNVPLAKRLESNMMAKAEFLALCEERKANRAGSGFDEFGKHAVSTGNYPNINEGMFVSILNSATYNGNIKLGYTGADKTGVSKTNYPIANVNGVSHRVDNGEASNNITLPTAPTIYPHDTVLTAEQISSGVIKHADASNSGLIVNGKFDTDTSGWVSSQNGTITFNSGKATITANGVADGGATQAITTIVGKKYIVECDMSLQSGTSMYVLARDVTLVNTLGSAFTVSSTTNRFSFEFTATTSVSYIYLRTSISSSGTVDNIAVYPADAISHSDLVFLESYHEDISEKNFVYPLGNVQYLGANTDGLTGIANGAFTGFETYSLFGNWQTPSALNGKGYVWSSLTEAQKKSFIANPENNCYLDGDKTIQVRYRVRVVQGLGDVWGVNTNVSNFGNTEWGRWWNGLTSNRTPGTFPQGKSPTIPMAEPYLTAIHTGSTSLNGDLGIAISQNFAVLSYTGRSYALPIALASRRNQGLYHNTYNPNGTKLASDGLDCFRTAVSFTSTMDCFEPAKLLTASGYIGTVSGRPDGLFYDQVHESDILDLRNSSKKVEDYNRLISREFNKLVAGTYRGKEGEWEVVTKSDVTLTFGNYFSGVNTNNYLLQPNSILPLNQGSYNGIVTIIVKSGVSAGKIIKVEGILIDANYFQIRATPGPVRFTDGSIVPILTGTVVDVIFARQTTRTKSNTLLHCDIIGNPTNYPTSWKESGVFGTPLIVGEGGENYLDTVTYPTLNTIKLSRKVSANNVLSILKSSDNGATWTTVANTTVNTTLNKLGSAESISNSLVMVYYQTHTSMAVPVVNSEVLEIGDVFTSTYFNLGFGVELTNNLIGKVSNYPNLNSWGTSGLPYNISKEKNLIRYTNPLNIPLVLPSTISPAVKVFPYLTRLNGKAYLNLVFKEMKHNGTSWGDDSKFNIVDNVSTTTDVNGQTVLIGQKTVELPYFIGDDE